MRYFIVFYTLEKDEKRRYGLQKINQKKYINIEEFYNQVWEICKSVNEDWDAITLTNIIDLSKEDYEEFVR